MTDTPPPTGDPNRIRQVSSAADASAAGTPAASSPQPSAPDPVSSADYQGQIEPLPESPSPESPAPESAAAESPDQDSPAPAVVEMATVTPDPTRRTRISGTWVGVIIATVVLILLLVFILQNTKSVKISYFSAVVSMPLGVALLLGTIGGVLFAGVIASLRIWQLRKGLNELGHPAGLDSRPHRGWHRKPSPGV